MKKFMKKLRALGFRSFDRRLKAQEAALQKGDINTFFALMSNPCADKFWSKYQKKSAKEAAFSRLMDSFRLE